MKKYTKKQIQEAIKYWQSRLNEAVSDEFDVSDGQQGAHEYYVTIAAEQTNFMYVAADTEEQAREKAQRIIDAARDENDETLYGYIEKNNWSPETSIVIKKIELER